LKKFLKKNGKIILLIKPQFEIKGDKNKKGKIKDEKLVEEILKNIKLKIKEEGYIFLGLMDSPILGKKGGNKEYLMYLSF